jgi:hypothetical protein
MIHLLLCITLKNIIIWYAFLKTTENAICIQYKKYCIPFTDYIRVETNKKVDYPLIFKFISKL